MKNESNEEKRPTVPESSEEPVKPEPDGHAPDGPVPPSPEAAQTPAPPAPDAPPDAPPKTQETKGKKAQGVNAPKSTGQKAQGNKTQGQKAQGVKTQGPQKTPGKRAAGAAVRGPAQSTGAVRRYLGAAQRGLLRWRSPGALLALTVSTAAAVTLKNGLVLGLSATGMLLFCGALCALFRNWIPNRMIVVLFAATGGCTAAHLTLSAVAPNVAAATGIYLPLLAVNGSLLALGIDAGDAPPLCAALDTLAAGLGFTFFLCLLSALRELLGYGSLWGIPLLGDWFSPVLLMRMAPGGFILLAFLLAAAQWLAARKGAGRS